MGSVAGTRDKRGYIGIKIDQRRYWAHRLAFLAMTKAWPANEVDHVNLIEDDNRWENLRDVPHHANQCNKRGARADSKTGIIGVHKQRYGYSAQICERGNRLYLGYFKNIEDAKNAYLSAKQARDMRAFTLPAGITG